MTGHRLHHVGHVVREAAQAIASYRRMGFHVPPPVFPALPDAPHRAVGPGNTHVQLRDNFVELVSVDGGTGRDATLAPLDAPPEARDRLRANVERTAARVAAALSRFEGVHILVFETDDADADAALLDRACVPHTGVTRVQARGARIGYLEFDDGGSPEGRLAMAEPLSTVAAEHPNGALRLVLAILCVPDPDLADYRRRYERYLGLRAVAHRATLRFGLGDGELVIVPAAALTAVLPGETPPGLAAFVGFGVTVRDQGPVRDLLRRNEIPTGLTPAGDPFVRAAFCHGTAAIFLPPR